MAIISFIKDDENIRECFMPTVKNNCWASITALKCLLFSEYNLPFTQYTWFHAVLCCSRPTAFLWIRGRVEISHFAAAYQWGRDMYSSSAWMSTLFNSAGSHSIRVSYHFPWRHPYRQCPERWLRLTAFHFQGSLLNIQASKIHTFKLYKSLWTLNLPKLFTV